MFIGAYLRASLLDCDQETPILPFEYEEVDWEEVRYYVPTYEDVKYLTLLNHLPPRYFAALFEEESDRNAWLISNYRPHMWWITSNAGWFPYVVTREEEGWTVSRQEDRQVLEFDYEEMVYKSIEPRPIKRQMVDGKWVYYEPTAIELEVDRRLVEAQQQAEAERRAKALSDKERRDAELDREREKRELERGIEWAYYLDQQSRKPRLPRIERVTRAELENREKARLCVPYELWETGQNLEELLEKAKAWVALKRPDNYRMRPLGRIDRGEALEFNVLCDKLFQEARRTPIEKHLRYGVIVQGIGNFELRYDCEAFKIYKSQYPEYQILYAERKRQHWVRWTTA